MSDKREHSGFQHLLNYLKGSLANGERHELEREMERDPFTREALEGLEQIGPDQAAEDLLALHNQLRKRLRRRRRVAVYGMAATVASILIVGTIFLQLYDFKPDEGKNAVPSDAGEMTTEQGGPAGLDKEGTLKEPVPQSEKGPSAEPGETPEPPAGEKGPVQAGEKAGSEKRQLPVEALVDAHDETVKASEPAPAAKSPAMNEEVVFVEAEAAERSEPVPAAEQPSPSKEAVHVESDAELRAQAARQPETDRSRKGTAAVARYPQGMDMAESAAVKEVKLSQADDFRMETMTGWEDLRVGSPDRAEPMLGMEAFNVYVQTNLKIPEDAEPGKTAVVVLRFTVTQEGKIADIETVRSPAESYTRAAVSVLEEGPLWIPAMKDSVYVEDRVKYRFEFATGAIRDLP